MPPRLLGEIRARPFGPEQVRRLVASVEVARLRDLRVQEVEALPYVLRTRVAGMADVAPVLGAQIASLDGLVGERGAIERRGWVERMNRQPHDDEDDGEKRQQAAQPGDERRDEHLLAWVRRPAAGTLGAVVLRLCALAVHRLSGKWRRDGFRDTERLPPATLMRVREDRHA